MSRADRWWRPSTTRRPAQRARARRTLPAREADQKFDTGYATGYADALERTRKRDEQIRRLADAADKGEWALEELQRELDAEAAEEERRWWSDDTDDLTAVAREAGVLSDEEDKALWDSVPPHGSGMVVEIEQWLRDRGRWLDFLREHGDLPDDQE